MRLRRTVAGLLATSLAVLGALAAARAEPLDGARYEAALAAARTYSADQTLINYCLRGLGDNRPYLYIWAHGNLEKAIQRLKAAGGDPHQVEALAKVVTVNVRFFAPESKDAAFESQCASREVEKNAAMLMGPGVPLDLRASFKDFPH
jgi:hypothetical protein